VPITSGTYAAKAERVVTHWPSPDANGDGEQIWDGEMEVRDRNGDPVRHYNPPAGFVAHESRDGDGTRIGVTYVRKENGTSGPIKRSPSGEAVNIYPGETLVEYPDGSYVKLRTDKERKEFLQAHVRVDA
jgi:hypothetical protein